MHHRFVGVLPHTAPAFASPALAGGVFSQHFRGRDPSNSHSIRREACLLAFLRRSVGSSHIASIAAALGAHLPQEASRRCSGCSPRTLFLFPARGFRLALERCSPQSSQTFPQPPGGRPVPLEPAPGLGKLGPALPFAGPHGGGPVASRCTAVGGGYFLPDVVRRRTSSPTYPPPIK